MSLWGCGAPERVTPTLATVARAAPSAGGEATLLLMADLSGVLRPCGCTVELQKGGYDRLGPVLAAERARAGESLLLHAGPLLFEDAAEDTRKERQRARQAEVSAALQRAVGIDIAGLHPADAHQGLARLGELQAVAGFTLVGANLDGTPGGRPAWEIREVGGLRVGIFALAPEGDHGPLGVGTDPVAAAVEVTAAIGPEVDAVVLLSGLGLRETRRLARRIEGVDFAIVGGMGSLPTFSDEAEPVGQLRLIQLHREGRYLGRLTLQRAPGASDPYVDASRASPAEVAAMERRIQGVTAQLAAIEANPEETPAYRALLRNTRGRLGALEEDRTRLLGRHAEVPAGRSRFAFSLISLDWDLPQDEGLAATMAAFDDELAELNRASAGTLPEPAPGQAVFVGAETCLGCHTEATAFWEDNRHAHAWSTLERLNKTFDTECVSCHVTGYGQAGGSLVGQVQGRENVQCEACHGPGSLHAELGDPGLVMKDTPEETCVGCHNSHHSPRFDFSRWRAQLLVPGHGLPLNGP